MTSPTFQVVGINHMSEHWSDTGEEFLVQAHAEVQQLGQPGGEAFRVTVASPSMLVSELAGRDGIVPGRGYIFLNDFDEPKVLSWLQGLVERSGAASWPELQAYIERYFDWIE